MLLPNLPRGLRTRGAQGAAGSTKASGGFRVWELGFRMFRVEG